MPEDEAVVVRNAMKKYGDKSVLNGVNMSVLRGSIYGLLGASGCGKTTLLSCIVGIRSLDNGEIWVLGGQPGSKSSFIPGPRVGFMPQEISLVQEFTTIGALYYFGRINGLEDDIIEERYLSLTELLQLPARNCLIKHMSGGQQRRISLACALLHEPELLILDEPTVGLDPVLRENIWKHLINLTEEKIVTIIITTHYIDEAKTSDKIGLLRHGKLLAETSPNDLLIRCRCDSLEEAFLRLSQKQEQSEDHRLTTTGTELEEMSSTDQNHNCQDVEVIGNKSEYYQRKSHQQFIKHRKSRKFKALIIKNFLQFIRHPGGILFALIFPILQINVFFNAIGRDPEITMAVVNDEAGDCYSGDYKGQVIWASDEKINKNDDETFGDSFGDDDNFYDEFTVVEKTCKFIDISCRFLNGFNTIVNKYNYFNDSKSAINNVKMNNADGVMIFNRNFSLSMQERLNFIADGFGEIKIHLDMANRQTALFIEKSLTEKFFKIYSDILKQCNLTKFGDAPVKFEKPIFGDFNEKYSTFMAPGFLLTLTFFLATSVSSSIIIADRDEGVWYRSLVQGVTTGEILLSHLLTQLTIILIQVTVTITIAFIQYKIICEGSIILIIILIFSMGICGMCYGFFVSIVCTSHTVANYITTGSFYPVILLCGCIWPIEGMPNVLQWFSLLLPTTVPGFAMRNIIYKGYNIDDPQVYKGFIVVFAWTIILLFLCFFGIKTRKL